MCACVCVCVGGGGGGVYKLKPVSGYPRPVELNESQCDHPGLPIPNKPYGFCGRKAPVCTGS